jgi:hypothetical protein
MSIVVVGAIAIYDIAPGFMVVRFGLGDGLGHDGFLGEKSVLVKNNGADSLHRLPTRAGCVRSAYIKGIRTDALTRDQYPRW